MDQFSHRLNVVKYTAQMAGHASDAQRAQLAVLLAEEQQRGRLRGWSPPFAGSGGT